MIAVDACLHTLVSMDEWKACTHVKSPTQSNPTPQPQQPCKQVGQYKKQLEAQGWVYEMEVSFVEIYNEQVRDLLRSLNPDQTAAEVR